MEHNNKKNVCLGSKFLFQKRFLRVFYYDKSINCFWFLDEKKNDWVFFNPESDNFHMLLSSKEPIMLDSLKEISMKVFIDIREKLNFDKKAHKELERKRKNGKEIDIGYYNVSYEDNKYDNYELVVF